MKKTPVKRFLMGILLRLVLAAVLAFTISSGSRGQLGFNPLILVIVGFIGVFAMLFGSIRGDKVDVGVGFLLFGLALIIRVVTM
ncbi:MAG: hypothetical protein AAB443_04155 [Patescibacteria group bacterium]